MGTSAAVSAAGSAAVVRDAYGRILSAAEAHKVLLVYKALSY